jgi:predicted aspartyl protease
MIPAIQRLFIVFIIASSGPFCHGSVKLDALGAYLVSQGYGGAQLVSSGQWYHLPIVANGKPAHLVVDTGCPNSVIFRRSLKSLNLTESKTDIHERGAFGAGKEVVGTTTIGTLAAGNLTLSNVPVVVANYDGPLAHVGRPNGFLGLRELVKFGAILDFSHRLIYLRSSRPETGVSGSIKSLLEKNGFRAVKLSLHRGHLRVPGKVNDIACHFMVDSGAFLTTLDRGFADGAKLGGVQTYAEAHGIGKSGGHLKVAKFPSLWIGDYQIKQASAAVLQLDPEILGQGTSSEVQGFLGVEYLARNSAILDFISGTMYLRPRVK